MIKSFDTQRKQICFLVDLLRPNGNTEPLASFSEIASVFRLTKGAITEHYRMRTAENDCGRKNILTGE